MDNHLYLLAVYNIFLAHKNKPRRSPLRERIEQMKKDQIRFWYPYVGIYDPCPP